MKLARRVCREFSMCSRDDMRMVRLISACSEPESEWTWDSKAGRRGGGTVSDVRVEVEVPEGPASFDDRMRELALLETVMASRRVSAKVSPSIDTGSDSG